MTLLSVENLSLSINGTPILKDVNMSINPGEIVAITGESGSGKSMTALAAMQLLPNGSQATGRVLLGETDLLSIDERQMCAIRGRDIGMVFQEPMTALNPVMTIGDQVAETIRIHEKQSLTQANSTARAMLNRVGLDPVQFPMTRYPHELSGGQRQRVVIAMAIALRPKLLIADEPTTALDVTTQANILGLLKELVKEFNMGLLMITHDLAVVADMADNILVMRSGEIVESGPPAALFRNMKHPYTRMLFEASGHQVTLHDNRATDAVPLLELRNVSRDYVLPRKTVFARPENFRAVSDVNIVLKKGARAGLVGESGCGKSTLTRAILGLELIQGGEILMNGQDVLSEGKIDVSARRKMQVVFQDPYGSFNPRHRVARLISEPFNMMENPPTGDARRDVVAQVLLSVGLSPDDGDKFIHEFSGGQRQRIAIARALIIEPELIIFDEAVSALDVSIRAQILDLLAELSEKYGLTYLFISHDLSVVRTITDTVFVMKDGCIVEQGDTERVFSDPQHPYTQSLIAAAPVLPAIYKSRGTADHAN